MREIREPSRTVPVMAETEVLVVGSGPAGLSAALASAREGADTIVDGDDVKGVITESKSGRQAILARCVIDATGDADVAFKAGAAYSMLPKERRMPVSTTFGCSGVDVSEFLAYVHANPSRLADWAKRTSGKEDDLFSTWIVEPFNRAKEAGEMPTDATVAGYWGGLTEAGEATNINVAHSLGVDSTDVWDLTRAEMDGRQKALWALEALKKYAPGFRGARLRSFNSSLGTRESRRILGTYVLTERDVKNEARFGDTIGIFPEFLDAYGEVIMPTTGRYFQVPYGIVLPKKVENLLVAGRSVSAEKGAFSATRQMMCCTVTGQGAGVAAAVAVKQGVPCRGVNPVEVQVALEKQGVRIA